MKPTAKEKKIISEVNKLIPNVTINSALAGKETQVNQAHYFTPPENKYFNFPICNAFKIDFGVSS